MSPSRRDGMRRSAPLAHTTSEALEPPSDGLCQTFEAIAPEKKLTKEAESTLLCFLTKHTSTDTNTRAYSRVLWILLILSSLLNRMYDCHRYARARPISSSAKQLAKALRATQTPDSSKSRRTQTTSVRDGLQRSLHTSYFSVFILYKMNLTFNRVSAVYSMMPHLYSVKLL